MSSMLATRFSNRNKVRLSARPGDFLTEDQMRASLPSIFAAEAHDSRSDRYAYIPTSEVVHALGEQGFLPTFACQAIPRREDKIGHTKHMLRFRREADVGKSEAPETILINSHDGTTSYQLLGGIFRFVCENGLVCGERFEEVRIQHKGNVVDEVVEGAFQVVETFDKVLGAADVMKQVRLNRDEQIAFAEAANMVRFDLAEGERSPITAEQLLRVRRPEDADMTLWNTFNRTQEATMRGGLHGRTIDAQGRRRNMTTREVTGIDGTIKLNRALWSLAERMAELKQAA